MMVMRRRTGLQARQSTKRDSEQKRDQHPPRWVPVERPGRLEDRPISRTLKAKDLPRSPVEAA